MSHKQIHPKGWKPAKGYANAILSEGLTLNIAGPEVEAALLSHPDVLECAVIGAPDQKRGSIVQAHVVLKTETISDDQLTQDLQNHVKKSIAPYKYPRSIIFTKSLPKTQTGKIQRFLLRAL